MMENKDQHCGNCYYFIHMIGWEYLGKCFKLTTMTKEGRMPCAYWKEKE